MDLKCKAYGALCELQEFKINGKTADYEDFGEKYDEDNEEAEPYCCANMIFFPKEANNKILNKYDITEEEYKEVCDKLKKELSFGSCGLCE